MSKPGSRHAPLNVGAAIAEALALHRQGRLDEAEKIYGRVLKAQPRQFDALHLCGMLKLQRGRAGEALRLVTAALEVDPRSADALSNLGLVQSALKRGDDALASFERALAIAPDHLDALNNRGRALLERKRSEEALACFDHVLRLEPRHVESRINRANALCELEMLDAALAEYDAVLAKNPNHPGAHYNRGGALAGLGRHADAIAAYDRVLAAAPNHVNALNNLGTALAALNRHQDALASFAKALAVNKDFADAHFNAAQALLTLGDFGRGLVEYEWRWRRSGMPGERRNFGRPLWLGEYPLGRKTILLHAEQGLGDTIQFVRYAKLLARAGARAVLEVPAELAALLSGAPGVAQVVARGETLPAFDVHCPLASLPLALRTEPSTIPAEVPYLTASEQHIAKWRPRVAHLAPPRVAVAWSGSPTHANDRNRSIALSRLDPLLAGAPARFVSVQRDLRGEDAELIRRDGRITHVGAELADFADTAAVMALVDLVVTVDTAVAHLGGALGRPTWIMLPFRPDWRWMLDRDDSPWYPSARLFRQPAVGDWDGVIARVRAALARLA